MKNVDEILKYLKFRINEVKASKKYCFTQEDTFIYEGIENELISIERWIKEDES